MLRIEANSHAELTARLNDIEIIVGGRIGPNKRSKEQCELWVLREIINCFEGPKFEYPLVLIHGDKPDFVVETLSGTMGIEITEASPPQDGSAAAFGEKIMAEENRDYYLTSETSARKSGSPISDVHFVRDDIQKAISRKASKSYLDCRPTDLWIYPNSDAVFWLDGTTAVGKDWERINRVFQSEFTDTDKFRQIVVYFSDDNVWSCSESTFTKSN